MRYAQYILNLVDGTIVEGTLRDETVKITPRNGFLWEVICHDGVVIVNARADASEGRKNNEKKVGEARWKDGALVEKKTFMDQMNDAQWAMVERTLGDVHAGKVPVGKGYVDQDPAATAKEKEAHAAVQPDGWEWANYATGSGVIALIAGIVIYKKMEWTDEWIGEVLILLGIAALLYGGLGGRSECPKCKVWFRRQKTGRKDLGSRDIQKTVTKRDYVTDSSGHQTNDYVERHESATYHRHEWRNFFQCRTCQHTWSVDDFSDTAT